MESDLPKYSGRGNRLKLDRLWTEQLKRNGSSYLSIPSGSRPPDAFYKAIREFNDSKFWQCHDTMEELWLITPYPLRLFYHGLIKIAVGFHHVQQNNYRGAISKLSQGVDLMNQMPPTLMGVDVELLRNNSTQFLNELNRSQMGSSRQLDISHKVAIVYTRDVG